MTAAKSSHRRLLTSRLVACLEACRAELQKLLDTGALGEICPGMLAEGMFTAVELPVSLAHRIADLNVSLWGYFTPTEEWNKAVSHLNPRNQLHSPAIGRSPSCG